MQLPSHSGQAKIHVLRNLKLNGGRIQRSAIPSTANAWHFSIEVGHNTQALTIHSPLNYWACYITGWSWSNLYMLGLLLSKCTHHCINYMSWVAIGLKIGVASTTILPPRSPQAPSPTFWSRNWWRCAQVCCTEKEFQKMAYVLHVY